MKTLSKKNIYGLIFIILLTFLNCKKKVGNYANTESHPEYNWGAIQITKIVMAEGGLNARDIPSLEGKVSFLIPKYTILEPTEEVGEAIEIKDKKGKWVKVQYGDKRGYVFGGYLIKAILEGSEKNPDGVYYYTSYSLPQSDNSEPSDCRLNFMQAGCLIVIYKASNNQVLNAFTDTVATGWIDKDHLATRWSIGDAGYGGDGVKSMNVHTKKEAEVWRIDSQQKIGDDDQTEESERLCLKTYCFDLKKNPDLIAQIKATKGLKYFEAGKYDESSSDYSTEVSIGENKSLLFIPNKNIVVRKQ